MDIEQALHTDIVIVSLAQHVSAGFGVYELRCNTDLVVPAPDAAFQNITHAKLLPDLARIPLTFL